MNRQTIRTFVEVKGGVAKVLHTDPVLVPKTKRMGGDRDAEGINQQKEIFADRFA